MNQDPIYAISVHHDPSDVVTVELRFRTPITPEVVTALTDHLVQTDHLRGAGITACPQCSALFLNGEGYTYCRACRESAIDVMFPIIGNMQITGDATTPILTLPFRFAPGRLEVKPSVSQIVAWNHIQGCFARHILCDWGDLGLEDLAMNEHHMATGDYLFSAYDTVPTIAGGTAKVWVYTTPDRARTTVMLPSDRFD